MKTADAIADAIVRTLESPNVLDSNFEDSNIVDVINRVAESADRVARAITPPLSGKDATGGHIESLTEAVMGVTAALCQIASALGSVADAISETSKGG